MKVLVTSDLHGYLPKIDTQFDLLLICGDICPFENHNTSFQEKWLNEVFANWIKYLPYRDFMSRVVCIAGNHDLFFERTNKAKLNTFISNCGVHFIYLKNESYDFDYSVNEDINTIKIFGTPYCKQFGNWAFMRDNEKLTNYYNQIPDNVDILISHDAADFNNLGLIQQGPQTNKNVGNSILANAIIEKKPKYYFCGHIHSGNHNFEEVNGIKCANVALMDERYEPINKILEWQV